MEVSNRKNYLFFIVPCLLIVVALVFFFTGNSQEYKKIELTAQQAEQIGHKVWLNEGAGKPENLLSWNAGENHTSLGIGHFIWYSEGKEGPYKETFPTLLDYLKQNNVAMPDWLKNQRWSPWSTRDEMLKAKRDKTKEYSDLYNLLVNTTSYQVQFMVKRLDNALPLMVDSLTDEKQKDTIVKQFYTLSHGSSEAVSADGVYVLLDYVNFKGEGVDPNERYNNQGWGLTQVLLNMPQELNTPLEQFATSAKFVLANRVKNAPPERNEGRWLPGWNKRIDTYISQ